MKYQLILVLAVIYFTLLINQIDFKKIKNYIVIINFLVITQFFYIIYILIIDYLIVFEKKIFKTNFLLL